MKPVPKYPRIPYLLSERPADQSDRVLTVEERQSLLSGPVIVEEKLDGANVSVWFEGPEMRIASRGGLEAMDRGGILGRVRKWTYGRVDSLRAALGRDLVLYGEWLLLQHGVVYTRLPAPLVGFDLLDRGADQFLTVDRRDEVLEIAGVPAPPQLFRGVLGTEEAAGRLIQRSTFGDEDAEGIIIRALSPDPVTPRIAKLVRADFAQARGVHAGAVENGVLTH